MRKETLLIPTVAIILLFLCLSAQALRTARIAKRTVVSVRKRNPKRGRSQGKKGP